MEFIEGHGAIGWRLSIAATLIALAALVAQHLLHRVLLRLSAFSVVLNSIVKQCQVPMRFVLPLIALTLALTLAAPALPDDLVGLERTQHLLGIFTIAALTWTAMNAVKAVADGVALLHPSDMADNLHARRVQTQTRVLARIGSAAVLITGVAFILMTFPRARQLGTSLLASAGVAGLVAGLAARSVFSNLLAGLQIALTQPLRLDDVLVIEGDGGTVEEITSTYVVLRMWDQRRLIVPLQWFIEHHFQNLTRTTAETMGMVMLWVDYTLPVEPLRQEAKRLCAASAHWDQRTCNVHVTDSHERGMQIRVLVSASNGGQNFELCCELREALIDFLQREHPHALPRLRASIETIAAPA